MLTVEEIRALGKMDPELEPVITPESPYRGFSMETDLQMVRDMMAHRADLTMKPDPATSSFTEENIRIPIRDGAELQARVYRPKNAPADGCPGMVAFHGGGFVVGNIESVAWLCELFTQQGGIAVNVVYRHAPENPFPIPVNDAHDAVKWTAQNVANLGINPKKGFLLGGESAGANLSIVVSHLYRDEKTSPPLTGVYASIPSGVSEQNVPEKYQDHFISMKQNAEAPLLNKESIRFIDMQYKRDQKSPLAYPILFPDHNGVPKTYFQACGMDPIRDCSLILDQVYKEAGVPTKMDIYPGVPHGFWMIFKDLAQSKKHTTDSAAGLQWLLAK